MAITLANLFKGEITIDAVAGADYSEDIYQVPAGKRALIKNLTFYHTDIGGIGANKNGYFSITDSADAELFRIWWTSDLSTETVAVSSDDYIHVVGENNTLDLENLVIDDEQKIRMYCSLQAGGDWDIRATIDGALEDV